MATIELPREPYLLLEKLAEGHDHKLCIFHIALAGLMWPLEPVPALMGHLISLFLSVNGTQN